LELQKKESRQNVLGIVKDLRLATLHQKHECNLLKKSSHLSIVVPLENPLENIANIISYLGGEAV
jgi:hypothetical protein